MRFLPIGLGHLEEFDPQPGQTVYDPCCGTGSILLQARALGITAFGSDRNPLMVDMTRGNLAHFGYTVEVTAQDAGQVNHVAVKVVDAGSVLRQAFSREAVIPGQWYHFAAIANSTARTLTLLRFDAAAESFPGAPEANALLRRSYRDAWRVPETV